MISYLTAVSDFLRNIGYRDQNATSRVPSFVGKYEEDIS